MSEWLRDTLLGRCMASCTSGSEVVLSTIKCRTCERNYCRVETTDWWNLESFEGHLTKEDLEAIRRTHVVESDQDDCWFGTT